MSWNVTGAGTKAALLKQVTSYFDSMIEQCKGGPNEAEYSGAKAALLSLIGSAPEAPDLLKIEAWGSAGLSWFNAHCNIDLIVATFKG